MHTLMIGILACTLWIASTAHAALYTLKAGPLRAAASTRATAVQMLDANETLEQTNGVAAAGWTAVRVGKFSGFVPAASLSQRHIEVHKQERALLIWDEGRIVGRYKIALGANAPVGDKQQQGDRATPEGRFFLAEQDAHPEPGRYGARSMRLSYPSAAHARRGLETNLIDKATYNRIVSQIRSGQVPEQNTRLGGSIRIHGGGSANDWTLGCIALTDPDVRALFTLVQQGTRVDVFASAAAAQASAAPIVPRIVEAAHSLLPQPAFYSQHAMGYTQLAFPNGDIDPAHAVCSDIAIRTLRAANIDLQSLIWEDRLRRPQGYWGKPNWSIDHRRVRNLVTFFDRWADPIPSQSARDFKAGDLVVFDTGVANGTPFDHIGVVGRSEQPGFPPVINIWAPGAHTNAMPLLGTSYPKVVAHYRVSDRARHW